MPHEINAPCPRQKNGSEGGATTATTDLQGEQGRTVSGKKIQSCDLHVVIPTTHQGGTHSKASVRPQNSELGLAREYYRLLVCHRARSLVNVSTLQHPSSHHVYLSQMRP
jgi:hypothetical protein